MELAENFLDKQPLNAPLVFYSSRGTHSIWRVSLLVKRNGGFYHENWGTTLYS